MWEDNGGEVFWGWETQLFQTHSCQLLFFCREVKEEMACTDTSPGIAQQGEAFFFFFSGKGGLGWGDNEAASL